MHCTHCSQELEADHTGPCPVCGKSGRSVPIGTAISYESAGSISWSKRKEYLEKSPKIHAIVLALTFGAPFLGFVLSGSIGVFVGIILAAAAYFLGPLAVMKVKEIERGP